MRKVGAHYYLRPDGSWGKRPVITIDSEGSILSVKEMGDDFREEPGLEFFSGVIIPGFVENWQVYNLKEESFQQQCKKALIDGTLKVAIHENQQSDVSPLFRNNLDIHVVRSDSTNQLTKNYQSAWDAIQEDWKRHLKSFDLAKSLVNHTSRMAATVGMDCNWGMIQKNAQPGLLLLQKVDWTTFTLTEHSSVRILNR